MIYFEANVTTTIPNTPNSSTIMYSNSNNSNANNGANQQYMADYSYQQAQQPQQPHTILPPPGAGGAQQQQQQQQNANNNAYSYQTAANTSSSIGSTANVQPNVTSNNKFTPQDIQILKQLLVAGEKHKWKQITKEINQSSSNNSTSSNGNSASGVQDANSPDQQFGGSARHQGKNVSPTFVIKQYQSLLGLPNNANFFGTLGSSLPYVVAPNGWDDISDQNYPVHFGTEDIE
ncbi:uncharacterized protein RJT20DRAFT_1109 [Scheffersomyces xylosifermentans]|uniref:uncharacterized protein n=1 Tax=Scheffersomyces xylosifermentans TaxID=1304137 RepID=UPI00315D76ED